MLPVRKRAGLWGPPWVSIAPKRDVEMASHRGGRSPAVYPGVDAAAWQPFQGRVTFEEVAVYFTEEEWGRLDPGERSLYSEVMFENYKTVSWLESHMNAKPHLISWLEDREKESSLQSAAEEERLSGGLRKYLLPDQVTNWMTNRRDIQWTDLWDGQTTDGMTDQHLCLQDSLRYAATLASLSKKRKVDREGRRFQDKWKLDYFFTEVQNNCVCLICQKTVAVFKEFNIKRHYQTKHADYAKLTGKERSDKLMELEAALVLRQCFFARARESSEDATKASYRVAALMAKHCKHFTEGEFIKDCAMQMVEQICPERKQDFANVCLARNTLARRIEDISSDLKRQLAAKGAEFDFFSLACDVSTEASESSQLLIFLRGVDKDMNVSEELLDLQSLKDQRGGTELFACVCSAVDGMRLAWNKVTGIVTDGAPAMAGERSGLLASLVCQKVSEEGGTALKLPCILHRQALWAKHLRYDHVTKPVIKTINFIRARALNHPQFQQFLQDIQAEDEEVYRSDIRGLSWGAALPRFYSLREEIGQFLTAKGQPMPELSDPAWLADLAFFADITQHVHGLNAGLQRQNALVTQLYSHLKVFMTKLQLFQRQLSQTPPNTSHFPSLQQILSAFPGNDLSVQIRRYESELSSLAEEFQQRFQDFTAMEKDVALFSNPFSVAPDDAPNHLQLEIIELQCDVECRTRHQQLPLAGFYRQLDTDRFREVRTFAKKMLSLFGSTYLCEKTASIMNGNKSRMRKRLSDSHLQDILRIKTTGFEPDLAYIIQSRSQCHPSH